MRETRRPPLGCSRSTSRTRRSSSPRSRWRGSPTARRSTICSRILRRHGGSFWRLERLLHPLRAGRPLGRRGRTEQRPRRGPARRHICPHVLRGQPADVGGLQSRATRRHRPVDQRLMRRCFASAPRAQHDADRRRLAGTSTGSVGAPGSSPHVHARKRPSCARAVASRPGRRVQRVVSRSVCFPRAVRLSHSGGRLKTPRFAFRHGRLWHGLWWRRLRRSEVTRLRGLRSCLGIRARLEPCWTHRRSSAREYGCA
jgi:hypothetical protein